MYTLIIKPRALPVAEIGLVESCLVLLSVFVAGKLGYLLSTRREVAGGHARTVLTGNTAPTHSMQSSRT